MTHDEVSSFLFKNDILDFIFQESENGRPESVVFDIGQIEIRVYFYPEQKLVRFKRDADKEYQRVLKTQIAFTREVLASQQKILDEFKGIKWKDSFHHSNTI